jgi:D-inositol-3-phosphate glycosyltransferase
LEALAILKQRGKSPYLLIAGEFWEDIKDYEAKIHSLGLLDLVRIDNRYIPNEEVGVFFSAADLFVAPYLDGTQSGAISVAMSQNVPILATDRIAGDLAWVSKVPAGDAEALANGIINCLEELETPSQFQSQTDNSWSGITELLNGIRKTL